VQAELVLLDHFREAMPEVMWRRRRMGRFEVEEQCILGFCQWIVSPGSEYTNNGLDGENGEGYAPGQGETVE
jgi:hypothetical protein